MSVTVLHSSEPNPAAEQGLSAGDWAPAAPPNRGGLRGMTLSEARTLRISERPGRALVARLMSLLSLQRGWDTYGSRPVSQEAALTALQFLVRLPRTPAPSIVPTPEGRVQLEWHAGPVDIELECHGNGLAVLFGASANEELERWVTPGHPLIESWLARLG